MAKTLKNAPGRPKLAGESPVRPATVKAWLARLRERWILADKRPIRCRVVLEPRVGPSGAFLRTPFRFYLELRDPAQAARLWEAVARAIRDEHTRGGVD